MSELKPCPFCGSMNLEVDEDYIVCNDCGCFGPDGKPYTVDAAIWRWNQRTERTCNMTWHYSDNGGSAYTCSNCGRDTYPFHKSFEYCPHCTAKVVE